MLDEQQIREVIIGCSKSVILAETRYYRNRLRPRKPSGKQLVLSSIYWPSLSKINNPSGNEFRPFPYVKSKLNNLGVDTPKVDSAVVSRAMSSSLNIGYYQKREEKNSKDGISGPNVVYTETSLVTNIKKLVTTLKSRSIIYRTLARSNILERYLRILNYVDLIRRRHISVKDAITNRRAYSMEPFQEGDINDFAKGYIEDQKFLKQKSIKEIFSFVCKISRNELIDRHDSWHTDKRYTRFFIDGGIAYNEVKIVYPTK